MSKGRRIPYSSKELAWIKKHSAMPRREAHALFCARFHRRDISVDSFKQLCLRHGWTTGRTGCFQKCHIPHNKGQRMPYNANAAATQFQSGRLPHNTKYLGHERVTKEGYVEISVDQVNPHTGFCRRYVLKHRYLWEQLHGSVPLGHVLKCLDGNRCNTDPSNWVAIPRAILPFLNGHRGPNYDLAHPSVKSSILVLAKLKHARFVVRKSNRKTLEVG